MPAFNLDRSLPMVDVTFIFRTIINNCFNAREYATVQVAFVVVDIGKRRIYWR